MDIHDISDIEELAARAMKGSDKAQVDFWLLVNTVLGQDGTDFGQALGMGMYDPNNAKPTEAEIIKDMMVLIRYEHRKLQP